MIVKILRDDSFAALLKYLLAVRKAVSPNQVEIHNLVSIPTAVAEMEAVFKAAPLRSRIVGPVAHIIIGWKRDKNPTLGQQKEAARRLIRRLGLERNQHVIVVHDEAKGGQVPGPDGRHFETHIGVNRVKFDGSVANLPFEFVAGERACADIAYEMGFAVVPGRFNGLKNEMNIQGLGNAVGSIAASGKLTISSEIRGTPERLLALQNARSKGWDALLEEFHNQNIDIIDGPKRRRAHLQRGLVMVDRHDRRRKLKLSALDTADQKWSVFALKRELGPMPENWRNRFAAECDEHRHSTSDQPGVAQPENIVLVTPKRQDDVSLAEEILSDPMRLGRLRAARASGQWGSFIGAARGEGLGIEPGFNARRGTISGLVLVDLSNPARRVKLSALDSSIEKWGQKALEKDLGPWPVSCLDNEVSNLKGSSRGVPSAPPTKGVGKDAHRREFDIKAAYALFEDKKLAAITHNRACRLTHRQQKDALYKGQSGEREFHYAVRRARRDLIDTVFGARSATGLAINDILEMLFNARLCRLRENQRLQQHNLQLQQSRERVEIPLWPDVLREAENMHVRQLADDDRHDELLTQRIRSRRDRIRSGAAAQTRLARAQAHAYSRLRADCGRLLKNALRGDPRLTAVDLKDRLKRGAKKDTSQSIYRRLPKLVEELREEVWCENVRQRRDRLHGSDEAKSRLERIRARVFRERTDEAEGLLTDSVEAKVQDLISAPAKTVEPLHPSDTENGSGKTVENTESVSLNAQRNSKNLSYAWPVKSSEANPLWVAVAADYALWVRGRSDGIWSATIGERIAAAAGLNSSDLMNLVRRQCLERYGHEQPQKTTWKQRESLHKEIVARILSSDFVALQPIREEVKHAIRQAANAKAGTLKISGITRN